MKNIIRSFRDLEVYQKLVQLHLEIDELTMRFPAHERYELGSQVRRSSNAAPAILAEGWNNKHTKIYLEAISRAIGEVQETGHHVDVAFRKHYLETQQHVTFLKRYDECEKMLWGLAKAVSASNGTSNPHTSHLPGPPLTRAGAGTPHTSDAPR